MCGLDFDVAFPFWATKTKMFSWKKEYCQIMISFSTISMLLLNGLFGCFNLSILGFLTYLF